MHDIDVKPIKNIIQPPTGAQHVFYCQSLMVALDFVQIIVKWMLFQPLEWMIEFKKWVKQGFSQRLIC